MLGARQELPGGLRHVLGEGVRRLVRQLGALAEGQHLAQVGQGLLPEGLGIADVAVDDLAGPGASSSWARVGMAPRTAYSASRTAGHISSRRTGMAPPWIHSEGFGVCSGDREDCTTPAGSGQGMRPGRLIAAPPRGGYTRFAGTGGAGRRPR
ncbi:MAG: hypothetical protein MZV64_09320 [Ignavibacteriales bacterium]|nr:hypothetical protein [Ignavibacteriales bacterium]